MPKEGLNLIFVVGAPRSGTHLLGSILSNNIEAVYLNEVNDYWKKAFNLKYDYSNKKTIAYRQRINIIKYYKKMLPINSKGKTIIDKTAANSLRINLLADIFPSAKFIHIIRDGRDVAESIKKKCYGDGRKVTKNIKAPRTSVMSKSQFLIREIREKFSKGLKYNFYLGDLQRKLYFVFKLFGVLKTNKWGCDYPNAHYYYNNKDLIEYGVQMWAFCVTTARNSWTNISATNSFYELKFEDLISNPESTIHDVLCFIEGEEYYKRNYIKHNIIPNIVESSNHLDTLENFGDQRIGKILDELGYR